MKIREDLTKDEEVNGYHCFVWVDMLRFIQSMESFK